MFWFEVTFYGLVVGIAASLLFIGRAGGEAHPFLVGSRSPATALPASHLDVPVSREPVLLDGFEHPSHAHPCETGRSSAGRLGRSAPRPPHIRADASSRKRVAVSWLPSRSRPSLWKLPHLLLPGAHSDAFKWMFYLKMFSLNFLPRRNIRTKMSTQESFYTKQVI